ncbi:protein kinase domain-containing protein [Cellulomonas hominis]
MTSRRGGPQPPEIAGHRYVRVLGSGGFADVFLYEQDLPRRQVAVKVLHAAGLDDDSRARFRTEADVMARLSHHPSIVTIHQADIAGDGRPYLVMEYCARPGLGQRYRSERLGVAEVLRLGVRLSSAVETAHRAGILHRDIKPANVLVTDFGWPALTDFGIASTVGSAGLDAVGMSVPWSPPEMLSDHPTGDVRSDVYSLASTLYSLLAGRAPFEVPGGRNDAADMIARIERLPVPATGREDVPPSLHRVLARAMQQDPAQRYPSAVALGRALQQAEVDLGLAITLLDLPDDEPVLRAPVDAEQDDATRLRPVTTISPEPTGTVPTATAGLATPDLDDGPTRARPVRRIDPVAPAAGASADGASADGVRTWWSYAVSAGADAPPRPGTAGPGTSRTGATDGAGADGVDGATARRPGGRPPASAPAAGGPPPDALGSITASPGPSPLVTPPPPPTAPAPRRARGVLALGAAAVVVAAVVLFVVVGLPGGDDTRGGPVDDLDPPGQELVVAVPAPVDLAGTRQADGTVVFTWTNPDPAAGDQYLWGVRTATGEPTLALVDATTVTVPAGDGAPVCIEVSIVRADRRASATAAEGCEG